MLILSFSAQTQQDVQLSQQYLSRINVNPAATGTSNYADAYLFARQQWMGFEGAPSTQMLNAHGYVQDIRSGVGLSIVNDMIGRNRCLNMMFSYAYHIQTGEERFFSLGLSAGLIHRRFGGNIITEMIEIDPDIREILSNGQSVYRPDVNFGLIYSSPKFAFGLSATHLTHYLFKESWFRMPLHGYAFMEFGLDFSQNVRFTPRAQVMSALADGSVLGDTLKIPLMDKVDLLFDLGGTLSVQDKFWIGGAFRAGMPFSSVSVTATVGVNLTPNLRIGYAYDHKLGNTFQNVKTYGSHEIVLNYRMKLTEVEVAEATPRFFE